MKKYFKSGLMVLLGLCLTGCQMTRSPHRTDTAETTGQETATLAPAETGTDASSVKTESTSQTESETQTQVEEPLIIVLDAGHDDGLCRRDQPQLGVNEQDLNLIITLACRDELEKYEGVEVHLVREDGTCVDIKDIGEDSVFYRTDIGTKLGADLFVTLHNNGSTGVLGAEANGAEVYVSNYGPYKEAYTPLGELILDKLCSVLDLNNRGIMTRTNEEKGYYEDGSAKDYHYYLSNCVDNGFPSIIIEHAFMDNLHDNAILLEEDNLKIMGIADAQGIAEFYGLKLKENH